MGLKLISDSYLDGMSRLCGESGLAFEPRMMDGKHHIEILKDLAGSQHDLVVIGALGIGRARDSVIGSVCERVARQSDRDVWVVKHVPDPTEAERDTILVGMDGSPQSFGALMTAIDLARTFGKNVETIAVYDPYLHYSVFNGIAILKLYAGVVAADTPSTDPTVFCIGSYAGERLSLDAEAGKERWSVDAGSQVIGAASLIGETVYFANLEPPDDRRGEATNGEEVDSNGGAYNPVISDGKRC